MSVVQLVYSGVMTAVMAELWLSCGDWWLLALSVAWAVLFLVVVCLMIRGKI